MQFPRNQEIFRAVDRYPNYEISSHGRIRNAKTGRILKSNMDKQGYCITRLSHENKKETLSVHRLVAKAFIENNQNTNVVDHIDRNRANNNFENLRWTNQAGNQRNRKISSNNTSGTKGVHFSKAHQAWFGLIMDNDGNLKKKCFGITRHPNAKELATAWRLQKEEEFGYFPTN